MFFRQGFNKLALTIVRWLSIAVLLAGMLSPAAVGAAQAPQAGEPAPDEYSYYLPLVYADTGPGRDDLLAAESNLSVLAVSAGYAHACALLPDGRLICWGLDSYGQASPPPGEYRAVSSGANHTCALRADNTLACWGDNTFGQASPPAGTFTQVSAGGYHTCALRAEDGSLACWGWNAFSQLDNIPTGAFRQVSAGNQHTCALRDDDSLACWGWNADGQATAPAGSFTQVDAGGTHTCAVAVDGTLACWGSNLLGQSNPPAGAFREVSAGANHSCALGASGEIRCWGSNGLGQLVDIPEGAFRQISAGGSHTCAVREDGGMLACWGWNRYGQSLPPSGVLASAGFAHACAVRVDGMLVCWGENDAGQTEPPAGVYNRTSAGDQHSCAVEIDGSLTCWGSNAAGQSSAPQTGTFLDVSAGGAHSCALRVDGALSCWGSNLLGQANAPLGAFSQVSAGGEHSCGLAVGGALSCWGSNSAGQTTTPAGTFAQVSAGGEHSCALNDLGRLACWGSNSAGQSAIPTGTFAQVSAGDSHTCALRADGTLACWGDTTFGQTEAPQGIFSQVSAGGQHSCAVTLEGQVTCWGSGALAPVLAIFPENLPEAQVGAAYSQTFSATGGTPPYTFQVSAGALPAGLALAPDGQLSGQPQAAGSFTFTIQARDSAVLTATGQRAYTLLVSDVLLDSTPPVISAKVSGTLVNAGWYVGPVTVSWTVTDAESPVSEQTGCETVTLSKDTPGVTLACSATSAGGSSTESVSVKIDQTPPENVTANPEREPDSSGWYNQALKIAYSGSDALSGIDSCTRVVYDGPDSAEASVSGTCTDVAGNTSLPVSFTFKYDSTPPLLDPYVKPNPVYLHGKAIVKPNASDELSGLARVKCDEPDTSTVGLKKVYCTAWDEAGNKTQAKAKYSVIYRFLGFLPPVENPPAVNRVVAGQTVPIKFRLADDKGLPVSDLGDFEMRVEQVACPLGAPELDLAEQYESSLTLNMGGGLYHKNWKTSPDLSGACVRLIVDLGEGPAVEHVAWFYFRK